MAEDIKEKVPNSVVVIASVNGASGNIASACGSEAVAKGAHAGKIVGKVAALTGGKGGGRPDNAMAGIGDSSKAEDAIAQAENIVAEFIK